jgi:hypothetical protein
MKILNIILNESAVAMYRDLTDTQSIVLIRAASGKTTYETASEREQGVMDELAELGLLNDLSYEPTQKGQAVAELAHKYGPRDSRIMAKRNAAAGRAPVKGDGRYSDVGDHGDSIEPGDDMVSMSQSARTIDRGELAR